MVTKRVSRKFRYKRKGVYTKAPSSKRFKRPARRTYNKMRLTIAPKTYGGILAPYRWATLEYRDVVATSFSNTAALSTFTSYYANNPRLCKNGGTYAASGFRLLASIYNYYTVYWSTIYFTIRQKETTDLLTMPVKVGVKLDRDGTIATSGGWPQLAADPLSKMRTYSTTTDKCSYVTIQQSFRTKKFFDVKDIKDNRAALGALINANPTKQAYFIPWYQTFDTATAISVTPDFLISAYIKYRVLFSTRKDVATLEPENAIEQEYA